VYGIIGTALSTTLRQSKYVRGGFPPHTYRKEKMVQNLISGDTKLDLAGNVIYCKALKTGFYAGNVAAGTASFGNVLAGAALTLSATLHEGLSVAMDQATGSTITLPTATGNGNYFDVYVSTSVTSNNHIFKTNGTDTLVGTLSVNSTATSAAVGLQGTNKTLTFSPTTTGGLKGGWIHAIDIAPNIWFVEANMIATGTAAVNVA
jgi:hypothetical protein